MFNYFNRFNRFGRSGSLPISNWYITISGETYTTSSGAIYALAEG